MDIHSAAMQHSPILSDFRAHQVDIKKQKHISPNVEDLCFLVEEFCHETWLLGERNTNPYIVSAYTSIRSETEMDALREDWHGLCWHRGKLLIRANVTS